MRTRTTDERSDRQGPMRHEPLRRPARPARLRAARNAKLTLVRDYFREHARSRPRLGAGGAHRRRCRSARQAGLDPRADRRAHRSAAVRAVLRLCRRPRRDRRADLAAPSPAHEPTTPELVAEVVDDAAPRSRKAEVPALLAGWLDALDADRPLGAAEADDRRPAGRRLGAAGQDRRRASSASVERRRDRGVWHGAAAALRRPVRLAGGPRRQAGDRAIPRRSAR